MSEFMFVNPEGRILDFGGGAGSPIREFADGAWGPLRSPVSLGDFWDDDSRPLTQEEEALVSKAENSGSSI